LVADVFGSRYPDQAVHYYLEGHAAGRLLDGTGPRTWLVCAALASLVASALVVAVFGTVDVVTIGAGRLDADARHAVAFVPEDARGPITPGATVTLDVEVSDVDHSLRARVRRVLSSPAAAEELEERSGAEVHGGASLYRVDLDTVDDAAMRRIARQLHRSVPVRARFTVGSRRLLSLILDPLRRWGE
jgi:hypothetical protein